MISAHNQQNEIELLAKEDWEKGAWGKILRWTLTVGRHIVILTELIVILAFLSRFKLDRDLTDLNDSLKQKQAIVEASASFEKKYRQLQKQVAILDQIIQTRLNLDQALNDLAKITPLDVYFEEISAKKKSLTLKATALSETGLTVFLQNLRTFPLVEQISLAELSAGSDQDIGIKFHLTGNLK
jgi:Tfp pilus assembly protein PilN